MSMDKNIVKFSDVEKTVVAVRGQQVILDTDVAVLYGVETKRVNEAVKNNPEKFPEGYILALTDEEWDVLRSKFSTLKTGRTRRTYQILAQSLHRKRPVHACHHPEKPQGRADHHRHCGDLRQNPGIIRTYPVRLLPDLMLSCAYPRS